MCTCQFYVCSFVLAMFSLFFSSPWNWTLSKISQSQTPSYVPISIYTYIRVYIYNNILLNFIMQPLYFWCPVLYSTYFKLPWWLVLWVNVLGAWVRSGGVAGEISLGSRLRPTASDAWISGNGTFAFGFTSSGEEDRFQLAIWFAQLPGDQIIVWSPNR